MKINEIFYSIQGEGSLAGMPTTFIRLAGCHLRCKWCDTKYAWSPDASKELSIEQLIAELAKFPANHIVITGGEPFLSDELADICQTIAGAGRSDDTTNGVQLEISNSLVGANRRDGLV